MDLPKTIKSDEGLVTCFARNIHGQIKTTAELKIIARTDYRSVLRNAKTGEAIVLEDANEDKNRSERSKFDYFIRLKILKIKKKDNLFLVSSPERRILERLPLVKPTPKQTKPADKRFAPKFKTELEPKTAKEGEMIVLNVEFSAEPFAEVIWYKDGFQMQSSEDFHIDSTATSSSLRIREAFKSDSGMYQVKLYNEVGISQSKAYLSVIPSKYEFILCFYFSF
jgi:hypothetical protein